MRRDPVIGQTVPGGKLLDDKVRSEEAERARERGHARPVAADDDKARCRRVRAGRAGTRQICNNKPLGTVRDARERERAGGDQKLCGSARHAYLVRSRRWLKSRSLRNSAVSWSAGT